jgi:hypothetical protein
MAKKIIVRLWKGGVNQTLVANSQIITIDGLGSGPISASDFADNKLSGQVNTSSQRGAFYKELRSPTWILTPVKYQVEAGADIVLNWAVNIANTTSVLKWYAVNVDSKILYTGDGLTAKYSPGAIPSNGLTGTFRVSTSPISVDREVQITLWNGEFNIATQLARSAPIKIIAKKLQVELPATVAFKIPIPLIIKGYPNEFVTYTGAGAAEGITGNVTLDSTGSMNISDIRGGRSSLPGTYRYTFDGNITADSVAKAVTITAEGYFLLSFASEPPNTVEAGQALTVTLRGAPNERIHYNHPEIVPSSAFNNVSSPTILGSNQTAPIQILTPSQSNTLAVNSLATFVFNGNVSVNRLTYNVLVASLKRLTVSGVGSVAQNTPYSVVVTSKLNDVINWSLQKPSVDHAYLDYYPNVRAAWEDAKSSNSNLDINKWVEDYHRDTGQKLGYSFPSVIERDFNTPLTGVIANLTDIGNDDGRATVQITTGLLGRQSPYKFVFQSLKLGTQQEHSVTVTKQFVMKVEGPSVVEANKPIPITIYSMGGDDTIKVFGSNLPTTGKLLPGASRSGVLNIDLGTLVNSPLSPQDYIFNFDSSRPDVINAGGTLYTDYSLKVISAQNLRVIGADFVLPNQTYSIVIRSSENDQIIITRERISIGTDSKNHAYFSLYPDVEQLFKLQTEISSATTFVAKHYGEIGNIEGRLSPEDAIKYLDNLPPSSITAGPLKKPNSGSEYGEETVTIGNYRYPFKQPIVLQLRGRQEQITHDFEVRFGDNLQVWGPQTSQIDSVAISIRGQKNEIVTVFKVTKGNNGISVPVTNTDGTRQSRRFVLGNDGFLTQDLIGDAILPLTPGSENRYYFFGDKSNGSAELAIQGAALTIQVGTALLYQGEFGTESQLQDMQGSSTLPTGSIWVMFKMLGGGGGGGGTDLDLLNSSDVPVLARNTLYNNPVDQAIAQVSPGHWTLGWLNLFGIWNQNLQSSDFDRSYEFTVTAGDYRIRFMCDNGGRVLIDGNVVPGLVTDGVDLTAPGTKIIGVETNINLTAGKHTIRLIGKNVVGPGSLGCIIQNSAGDFFFRTDVLPTQTANGRPGGRGGSAAALRGIVKITSSTTKKLLGAIGRGGGGGANSSNSAGGGQGGSGFSLPYSFLSQGRGGNGGAAGGIGTSGGGGGGGGSTLLAIRLTNNVEIPIAAAGGGGGGGGASRYHSTNLPLTQDANHGYGETPTAGSSLAPVYKEIYPQLDGTFKANAATGGNKLGPVELKSMGEDGRTPTGDGGGGGGSGQGYISSPDARATAGAKFGVAGGEPGQDQSKDGGGGTSGTALINADLIWGAKEYLAGKVGTTSPNDYIGHKNFYGHGGTDRGGNGRNGAISVYWTNSIAPPTDWGLLPEFPPVALEGINPTPSIISAPTINVTIDLPSAFSLNGYSGTDQPYKNVYINISSEGNMSWGKEGAPSNNFIWCKLNNKAAGIEFASAYTLRFTPLSGTFNYPAIPASPGGSRPSSNYISSTSPSMTFQNWGPYTRPDGSIGGGTYVSVPYLPVGQSATVSYNAQASAAQPARSVQGHPWRGSLNIENQLLTQSVEKRFSGLVTYSFYALGAPNTIYYPSYNGSAKLEILNADNVVVKSVTFTVIGKIYPT